jgi:hypothetical protein
MLTQEKIDSLPADVRLHIEVLDAHLDDALASLNRGAKTMRNARQRIIGLQSVVASLVIIAVASLFIAGNEHTAMMQTEVERQRISEELDEAHVNAAAMGCDLGRHIEKPIN